MARGTPSSCSAGQARAKSTSVLRARRHNHPHARGRAQRPRAAGQERHGLARSGWQFCFQSPEQVALTHPE
eukprot:1945874-Prymnesium_polylepis.1